MTVDGKGQSDNLNLANNPFYRKFTDSIPLTEEASNLSDSKASGMMRDLRELTYSFSVDYKTEFIKIDALIHELLESFERPIVSQRGLGKLGS